MKKTFGRLLVLASLVAAPLSVAQAETLRFHAMLSGAEEVPATTSNGTGAVDASWDSTTMTLSWNGSYTGLTGAATGAHVHGPAAKGANAGVVVPIIAKDGKFSGSTKLAASQAADLAAGKYYVNVHTAAHPDGEIRGQLTRAD